VLRLLRIAAFVIAIDQFTKGVLVRVAPDQATYNTGAAFSLPVPSWLVIVVLGALAVMVVWQWRSPRVQGEKRSLPLGLMVGGAISNVIDRLVHGAVIDFIDLKIWPVFNLADVAIVVGAGLFVWYAWRTSHGQPARTATGAAPRPDAGPLT
jgi:signal peptidase II